ncbi:hypothetical protein FKW77_002026 [Venturia effusa]|uniref:Carboxylesterase family protein n=1 Tax=Venturia effusa TaxID=50376 RepID=A0A517LKX5_9PEZI|nr:hypothetical protein FKW77_002026 [Venturia effusa]
MAPATRKTRAAAKPQDEFPSTDLLHNPLHPEHHATQHESDDQDHQVDEPVEDMSRPKSRKGRKNGAKKKAAKKQKTTPETTSDTVHEPEVEASKDTPLLQDEHFNPAAMPVLKSQKEEVTAEAVATEEPVAKEATPALASHPTIEEHVTETPETAPVATVEEAILAVEASNEVAAPIEESSFAPPEVEAESEEQPAGEPSEHPIDALDALEDTFDEVDKIIPGLDLPVGKPKTGKSRSIEDSSPSAPKTTEEKKHTTAAKPPVRAGSVKTKATPKIASITQPSATTRLRAPAASLDGTKSTSALGRSTSTRARPTSMFAPKAATAVAGLESKKSEPAKRRPISVQFPTPPSAPKSSKPLTQATFKLPGEEVAAKLKQAKEERLRRMEAKEAEKKQAKPRPIIRKPANTTSMAPRSRLSTGGAEPIKEKENIQSGGLKRSSTVTGGSTKRTSMISDRTKRTSMIGGAPGASGTIPPPKRSTLAAENDQKALSSSLSMPKQRVTPSTTSPAANTSAKRLSTMASSNSLGSKSRSVSGAASTAVNKGKEVLNRDRKASDVLEREKREKDDAMKKARAAAAERGRQASRDWAEKQKKAKTEAAAARRGSAEVVAV